jgi:hypothetical protein
MLLLHLLLLLLLHITEGQVQRAERRAAHGDLERE